MSVTDLLRVCPFLVIFLRRDESSETPVDAGFLALTPIVRWVMLFAGGWVLNPTGDQPDIRKVIKENMQ